MWLRRRDELLDRRALVAAGLAGVAAGCAAAELPAGELVAGVAAAALLATDRAACAQSEIKPLVFTDRARRLYGATLAAPALAAVARAERSRWRADRICRSRSERRPRWRPSPPAPGS